MKRINKLQTILGIILGAVLASQACSEHAFEVTQAGELQSRSLASELPDATVVTDTVPTMKTWNDPFPNPVRADD